MSERERRGERNFISFEESLAAEPEPLGLRASFTAERERERREIMRQNASSALLSVLLLKWVKLSEQ